MSVEGVSKTAAAAVDSSDKSFWHRFTGFYEQKFIGIGSVSNIFEFGVYHGASMRWLRRRFPQACIVGVDILPMQPDWPVDERTTYHRIDQGDGRSVRDLFDRLGITFDLIIEDGSHIPQHQASCLDIGLDHMRSGALYILEEIHTSHPENRDFAHYSKIDGRNAPNALNVLLALQHFKNIRKPVTHESALLLSADGFFTPDQVLSIQERVGSLELFKRTELPLKCWRCGSDRFDYAEWKCECGVDLYTTADSMSFAVWRK